MRDVIHCGRETCNRVLLSKKKTAFGKEKKKKDATEKRAPRRNIGKRKPLINEGGEKKPTLTIWASRGKDLGRHLRKKSIAGKDLPFFPRAYVMHSREKMVSFGRSPKRGGVWGSF